MRYACCFALGSLIAVVGCGGSAKNAKHAEGSNKPAPAASAQAKPVEKDKAEEKDSVLASGQQKPRGVAVDATTIYWANHAQKTVMKIAKSGGAPETLATAPIGTDLVVVDDANVYFTASDDAAKTPTKTSKLFKVAKTGGTATELAANLTQPQGLTADATHLYWADTTIEGAVMRISKTGGKPEKIGTGSTAGLLVDGDSVYWLGKAKGKAPAQQVIFKASKKGGAASVVVSNTSALTLAADNDSLYFFKYEGDGAPKLKLAKIAKSGGAPVVLGDGVSARNMVVAKGAVYFNASQESDIWKVPVAGGERAKAFGAKKSGYALAVDDSAVYYTDEETGTVTRAGI